MCREYHMALFHFYVLYWLSLPLAIIFQILIVFYSYVEHSIKKSISISIYLYTDLNNDKAVCKGILTKPLFTKQRKCLPNKYPVNTC